MAGLCLEAIPRTHGRHSKPSRRHRDASTTWCTVTAHLSSRSRLFACGWLRQGLLGGRCTHRRTGPFVREGLKEAPQGRVCYRTLIGASWKARRSVARRQHPLKDGKSNSAKDRDLQELRAYHAASRHSGGTFRPLHTSPYARCAPVLACRPSTMTIRVRRQPQRKDSA